MQKHIKKNIKLIYKGYKVSKITYVTTEERNLATIDQNGVITTGTTTGEFVVKCTTKNGFIAEKLLQFLSLIITN